MGEYQLCEHGAVVGFCYQCANTRIAELEAEVSRQAYAADNDITKLRGDIADLQAENTALKARLERVEELADEWTQPLVEDQGLEEEMYENVARSMANSCAAMLREALK